MAIDLGALTGTANNAGPKNTSASNASRDTDSDFSRTLVASRDSRQAHDQAAAQTVTQARTTGQSTADTGRTDARALNSQGTRSTTARLPHKTHDGNPEPDSDGGKAEAENAKVGENHGLERQRLTGTATPARPTTAATVSAITRLSPSAIEQIASTATATRNDSNAAPGLAARAPDGTSKPGDTASKTGARPQKTDDDSKIRDIGAATTGASVALLQAPLIAATTTSVGGAHGVAGADNGGRTAPANALRLSWQQLFTQLNGQTGQSDGDGQNAAGDDPAGMLAALNSSSADTGADAGDRISRFGVLHAADTGNSPANPPLTGLNGHMGNAATGAGTSAANGAAAATATLGAPPASDEWNRMLGQQTLRLTGSGTQRAQLQLHPQELGQLSISVTINDHNQAQIHFAAAHAHVRDAVEAALPQLRQSLAAGGLSLGQASVGDQNSQAAFSGDQTGSDSSRPRTARDNAAVAGIAIDAAGPAPEITLAHHVGGIDIFA